MTEQNYRPTVHSICPCGSSVGRNTALLLSSPNGDMFIKMKCMFGHAMLIVASVNGNQAEVQLIGTKPDWAVKVDPEKVTDVKPAPTEKVMTQSPLFAKGRQIVLEEAQPAVERAPEPPKPAPAWIWNSSKNLFPYWVKGPP